MKQDAIKHVSLNVLLKYFRNLQDLASAFQPCLGIPQQFEKCFY